MTRYGTLSDLPSIDAASRNRLLKDVLKGVSRSFYLTLRVLPKNLREPVGVAYLLARTADTIADRSTEAPRQRLESLSTLRFQLIDEGRLAILQELASRSLETTSSPKEQALFESLVDSFSLLYSLPRVDHVGVWYVLLKLIDGMEMDLTLFPSEDSGKLAALQTAADLDRYTFLVAGCVGEFWTSLTVDHESSLMKWDVEEMSGLGIRFGKALQLTNILRDIPRDLRNGRCYIPADELKAAGLVPEDLLDPANESRARAVLVPWMQTALNHFQAAEEYLTAIPRRSVRLRLACLWPLLLGLATLARLARGGKWLAPDSTTKVSRRWVYRMMLLSLPAVCSNTLLRLWIRRLRRQVEAAI